MRKFVWVPVVSLGAKTEGQFLELMSESTCFGGLNMAALKSCDMDKHIKATETVLERIEYDPPSAKLFLTGYMVNLSNTEGVILALVIACLIQAASCPYTKVLVIGQLETHDVTIGIRPTPYFEARLNTILQMGKQSEATPLYIAKAAITEQHKQTLVQLAAQNIIVKPIERLADVLVDFGISTAY